MITFHQIDQEFWCPGVHWYVEYFDDDLSQRMFPVGTAYVVVIPAGAQLNFILVADDWRGQGIATKLEKACRDRWPGLVYTSPMNAMGKSFLSKTFEVFEEEY